MPALPPLGELEGCLPEKEVGHENGRQNACQIRQKRVGNGVAAVFNVHGTVVNSNDVERCIGRTL